jgi:hypothetical protein
MPPVPAQPAPAPNYGGGDLDCADVGHEVYIDGDDPTVSTVTTTACVVRKGERLGPEPRSILRAE